MPLTNRVGGPCCKFKTDCVFSTSIYGYELKQKKEGAITYSTDRGYGVSKMFITSLGN